MQRIFQREFFFDYVGCLAESFFAVKPMRANVNVALTVYKIQRRRNYPRCFDAGDFFGRRNFLLDIEITQPIIIVTFALRRNFGFSQVQL